jgi:hypothetical protein
MIKVTIGESKPQEKPFPKLMIGKLNHGIVLALGPSDNGEGRYRVIYIDGYLESLIGKTNEDFLLLSDPNPFTDYNEPITIQNA